MTPHVAPSVLIVDKRPSPCLCHDDVICEFCVQANLILWERAEARGKKSRPGKLVNTLKKARRGRMAEMMGVHRNTVHNILKLNKIPPKYARRFHREIAKGIPG